MIADLWCPCDRIITGATVVRKHFEYFRQHFFMMISGLGQACLEYNLEVRMYALAFLCVMGCFYCSWKVIADGNRKTWAGMVLWALAAYSLLCTGGCGNHDVFWSGPYGSNTVGKPGLKRAGDYRIFIGYAPWLYFFYAGLKMSAGLVDDELPGLDEV